MAGCGSRTESEVVVYSSLDQELASPILNALERSTNGETAVVGKFDVESSEVVGKVRQRIAQADQPVFDVFWNNEILHTVRLQKLGLLEPRDWDVEPGWPKDMIASDGTWCGFAARARVLIVNTETLSDAADYPRSVQALTDPRWEDQCGMARPLVGTTATHWAVLRERLGREPALEMLKDVRENAMILSDNQQVAQAVSSGRLAWGLTNSDDAMVEKDAGYPVAIVFPDQAPEQPGTLRIPNTVAVLKNAPHPVAAGRLADYLVRPETEERLAMGASSQLPISRQSEFVPAVLPEEPVRWMQVDFEAAAEDWEAWAEQVRAVLEDEP